MDVAHTLNLTFDVWSALFNLVLITGVLVSRRHNEVKAQSLTLALLANFGVNVAEVLAYVFRGDPSLLGWWMVRIANFSVFFCNYLLLCLTLFSSNPETLLIIRNDFLYQFLIKPC
jgi:hypothetical protein